MQQLAQTSRAAGRGATSLHCLHPHPIPFCHHWPEGSCFFVFFSYETELLKDKSFL